MCTGRVDLAFVLRAFQSGADGVIIGGCWPGECHYVTEGNYDALGNMHLCKKLLQHIGVEPGAAAARVDRRLRGHPLRRGHERLRRTAARSSGRSARARASTTATWSSSSTPLNRLIPYLKLVEREKLRVPEQVGGGLPRRSSRATRRTGCSTS